jgi:hypothetical protein
MQLLFAQGSGKAPTNLGLIYTSFSYISARGCFKDLALDLMVTREQLCMYIFMPNAPILNTSAIHNMV